MNRASRREGSWEDIPDVRDGLTRRERVVLEMLRQVEAERPGRDVPTAMLYGRVVERLDLSVDELQAVLVRLGAQRQPGEERGEASRAASGPSRRRRPGR